MQHSIDRPYRSNSLTIIVLSRIVCHYGVSYPWERRVSSIRLHFVFYFDLITWVFTQIVSMYCLLWAFLFAYSWTQFDWPTRCGCSWHFGSKQNARIAYLRMIVFKPRRMIILVSALGHRAIVIFKYWWFFKVKFFWVTKAVHVLVRFPILKTDF